MASNSVLILKELEKGFNTGKPLAGIVRLETESGLTELSLSLVNLSPLVGGELFLYIFGKKGELYTFALSERGGGLRLTLDELNGVNNGFASALVLVKKDIPLTLAFGKTDGFELSLNSAKKLIAEKCLLDRKNARRKAELLQQSEGVDAETPTQQPIKEQTQLNELYNDEAVATVNYFELEEELKDKLEQIKSKENEELSNADGNATDTCQKEKETSKSRADFLSDEEDLFASQSQEGEQPKPFYITAQRELDTLFEKFPAYDNLKCYFPDSRWVKISYSNDKFYVVGLIKENKKEKYICYGVPEKYSDQPPKQLKGYCTFIPLSIFDMQGEGFWMMFQDAISGECILPKN